jgi:hypothetical protein
MRKMVSNFDLITILRCTSILNDSSKMFSISHVYWSMKKK